MEEYDDLDREIDAQINKQFVKLITNDIGPYTCQLFKHDSEKIVSPYASGILAYLGEAYYILTASHVTEDWSDENKLFLQIHGGYISVVGHTRGTVIDDKHKIDCAYIKLDNRVVKEVIKGNKFLTIDKFKGHRKMNETSSYCVFGYPTINQKRIDGKLKTSGAAYFVQSSKEKVGEYYDFDPMSHFILDYKGKGVDIKTGENVKVKAEHYGLSGCGLWLIELAHDGSSFSSSAKLIGIMTEFRRGKYECLIGCKIEIILLSLRDHEGLKFKAK